MRSKENDEGFIWSDQRLKSFGQSDPGFFRDRIREPNKFRAKGGIRERAVKQIKPTKDPLTGKFQKALDTPEGIQISDEARANLIYRILSIKKHKSRVRVKAARKAVEDKAEEFVTGASFITR